MGVEEVPVSVQKPMDIQGIEPWTSRMRSVRATTVPNALVFHHQTMYYKVARGHQVGGDTAEAILDLAPVSFQLAGRLREGAKLEDR